MPAKSILVILNPVSGQGDFAESREIIEAKLDGAGVRYEIRETEGEGDALEWASAATGFDQVMVGGGDGTVMEALSGLVKNRLDVPLAQLPMGTGNLLARALSIPIDLEGALDLALREGVATRMDVGHVENLDRYFALVAGSGWDAQLIADADRDLKDRLGFLAYVVTGIKNLFALKNSRVRLVLDEKEYRFKAHTVDVINVGEIYGSGIALGENMCPHDGKLDLAVLTSRKLRGLLVLAFRLLTRRFGDSSTVRYFSASRIAIEANPPLKLQIDGEAVGETPYEVTVVQDAVRLVVPRTYAEVKQLSFEAV